MKLVVAILSDERASRLTENLTKAGFSATKLASTGGFLRRGNATFLIGAEADQVETVIETIRTTCRRPGEGAAGRAGPGKGATSNAEAGATVFVIDIPPLIKV